METLACGEIGLTIDYFYSLTPREFNNIVTGYKNREEAHFKNHWEQTRQIMYAALQPHVKKGKNLDIKFPWETQHIEARKPTKTKAEMQALFKKVDANIKEQQSAVEK